MTRPAEIIVGFVYRTGSGYVGPENEPCVVLTIGRADEPQQQHPTFGFRPEQGRTLARELLALADRAEGQDPTQN